MKIKKIKQWTQALPLKEPYTIAYETISQVENTFLQIETDSSHVGLGCAAPDKAVIGDTTQTVQQALTQAAELLPGHDPLRPRHCLSLLPHLFGSARAALDMALWDLVGKAANLPLWKLFGGYRESIITSVTIGIEDKEKTLALAKKWLTRGFQSLKIKGGLDVENDIERLFALREALGKDVEMRFDANQGYNESETIRLAKALTKAEVKFIEQPTPKKDLALLARVAKESPLPIMADESVLTAQDALHIALKKAAHLINIKLQKVGGLACAFDINAVAQSAQIGTMVGCMDESALSIAASLHFALSQGNVQYADLDGHLDLLDDRAAGAFELIEGRLYPSAEPGLGLSQKLFDS